MKFLRLITQPTPLLVASALVWPLLAMSQVQAVPGAEPANACGPIYIKHFGPYDYRTERFGQLQKVEDFHFTPEVEAGLRGKNTAMLGADIDYTLKASPNHHRALITVSRVTALAKTNRINGMEWPVACYFDRAIRYRPDDNVVRMLYAQFLNDRKRTKDAVAQLDAALQSAGDNPFTHYNLGLLYFETGEFGKSLAQAHKALDYGFPRQDLAEKLKARGMWKDPAPSPGTAAGAVKPSVAVAPAGAASAGR
jgi:tetratricopeptide (TPR) repeat protein